MDLNARVYVKYRRKDGSMDGRTDRRTKNQTPISPFYKAVATKTISKQKQRLSRLRARSPYELLRKMLFASSVDLFLIRHSPASISAYNHSSVCL